MAIYIGSQKVIPHGIAKVYVGPNKVYEKSSYSTTLSDNTWDQIKAAIDAGVASSLGWLGQSKDNWQLVDLTANRYDIVNGNGAKTKAVFFQVATTTTQMFSISSYNNSCYKGSTIESWAKSVYNVLSTDLKNIISQVTINCTKDYRGNIDTTTGYTFLPAVVEVYGDDTGYPSFNAYFRSEGSHFSYLTTNAIRKRIDSNNYGSDFALRTRLQGSNSAGAYSITNSDGSLKQLSGSYNKIAVCFAI